MKIPREFEQRLFQFISQELQRPDGPCTAVELSIMCAVFARTWFGIDEVSELNGWSKGRALIAWAERLGKHVGDFYFNKKEG